MQLGYGAGNVCSSCVTRLHYGYINVITCLLFSYLLTHVYLWSPPHCTSFPLPLFCHSCLRFRLYYAILVFAFVCNVFCFFRVFIFQFIVSVCCVLVGFSYLSYFSAFLVVKSFCSLSLLFSILVFVLQHVFFFFSMFLSDSFFFIFMSKSSCFFFFLFSSSYPRSYIVFNIPIVVLH